MSRSYLKNRLAFYKSSFIFIALLLVLLTVSGCWVSTGNPQDTFDYAGPVAREQGELFNFIFVIAIFVFVIVEGLIIYISWQYRSSKRKNMPKQVHGNTLLEITWTIIPAIILIVIAIPTVQSIWSTSRPPEEGMNITAIGHQWWFEFRYPEQGIITANEMYIPVGEDIIITLDSQDVIHSFWVPKLAGKVDMVPISENILWLRADQPGTYYGQCAEFCGIAHAHMRFRVVAYTPEEFIQWSDEWFIPPDAPQASSPESEGQVLFTANCSTCHSVNTDYGVEIALQEQRWQSWQNDPEGSLLVSAPSLMHFGTRSTLGAGEVEMNMENLIQWIKDPSEIKPGTRMQQNASIYRVDPEKANPHSTRARAKLSDDEVEKIAKYLISLKPGTDSGVEQ